MSLTTIHIGQQTSELLRDDWCFGRYYVYMCGGNYLRNDGRVLSGMQQELLDLNGGTYFLTQQDAQDCLDRYNAAQHEKNQDT